MGQAKEIRVVPISKKDADALITRLHYSHKNGQQCFPNAGRFSQQSARRSWKIYRTIAG
jgi:hypothetical protein